MEKLDVHGLQYLGTFQHFWAVFRCVGEEECLFEYPWPPTQDIGFAGFLAQPDGKFKIAYRNIFQGPVVKSTANAADLTLADHIPAVLLIIALLAVGCYPNLLLNLLK